MLTLDSIIACGSMHFTPGQVFMIYALLFSLLVGAVGTVMNFLMILSYAWSKVSIRKIVHVCWWAYYALPYLLYWTGLFRLLDKLFSSAPDGTASPHQGLLGSGTVETTMIVVVGYILSIPCVAICQFIILARAGTRHSPKPLHQSV